MRARATEDWEEAELARAIKASKLECEEDKKSLEKPSVESQLVQWRLENANLQIQLGIKDKKYKELKEKYKELSANFKEYIEAVEKKMERIKLNRALHLRDAKAEHEELLNLKNYIQSTAAKELGSTPQGDRV